MSAKELKLFAMLLRRWVGVSGLPEQVVSYALFGDIVLWEPSGEVRTVQHERST